MHDKCGHRRNMKIVLTMLAFLTIPLLGINPAESLSDLDNITKSDSIKPETEPEPQSQGEAESDRESIEDSIKPETETEPQSQGEAESDIENTKFYPTEEKYCKINILDDNPVRGGYILKLGTNNSDELSGTPNKDNPFLSNLFFTSSVIFSFSTIIIIL